MLGDLLWGLLGGMFAPDLPSGTRRAAARALRRLRTGQEVRLPGARLTPRPVEGTVRLRPGAAWWRPDPTAAGEVLLCEGGLVQEIRAARPWQSEEPGRKVVVLADAVRRSSIVVSEPFVPVVLHAFPRDGVS
jgi:hypothetical protein